MATTGVRTRAGSPIERASASDRAFLAMDSPRAPEQFGVVLRFGAGPALELADVRRLMAERVPAVPRLRQRLLRGPPGCGGPIWVDDPRFEVGQHVRSVGCPAPGDEAAVLSLALSVVTTALPRARPLWSATLITGGADGSALVLVLHHALADGLGGLAVLAHLVDGPSEGPPGFAFPRPAPPRTDLARDAIRTGLGAVRHVGRSWHLLRTSLGAGGGLRPPRATPCSLIRPTGPQRRLAVVRTDLGALRAAAHRYGATVNDAILVAVAGALQRVLLNRGESIDRVVVTVPVSGREPDRSPALGNLVSPLLVSVPTTGPVPARLGTVAGQVRAHRAAATGPPPIAVLGWLFRPVAALGGFRWYLRHQHRFHTLVSHVRGTTATLAFGGAPITSAIPVGVGPGGNIPVYFAALSYADTLVLTAVVDPGYLPDAHEPVDSLRAELDLIVNHPSSPD